MYALLINLMAIEQVRVAAPDEDTCVVRPDAGGPGIRVGFTPSHEGRVFAADES